ncbi:cytochrome b/b6 domain-containing protein [Ectothiorhodospira lacustris]|uniref:cytochrome b/b6 domain-containing protein n=1 Tax=Ectothiorhodospira lacustris TaxID=2899127 RepID=UPI001EE98739|nr:cytochrome b/b6 domain-containing protein [Ectothiorhodospira lacustris]MCG5502155.1 cytochrome b/b6 domain-containing protein [Ectothiorhodospira lacustris]MCG5509507.1 cytochrome b/b6 domain-containing protein [Ectothiorhodospira lacustris]MCG5521698.1 cytochrome b/b6 domain-containing protein [Ectothiorhodospira lacustris]
MNTSRQITVWDPFVRIFHWGLASAFIIAYAVGDDAMDIHTLAGYAVLVLVLARIPWGFIGGTHARFRDFVRPPGEVMAHIRGLLRGQPEYHRGHNPLAGWIYVLMFISLIGLTVSGIATLGAEESAGPLAGLMASAGHGTAEAVEEIHEFLANFTLGLVLIHLTGVLLGSLTQKENLVRAMITGRKRRSE